MFIKEFGEHNFKINHINFKQDESKPLKPIYLTSDACTCKILKFLNRFSTKSSGKKYEFVHAKNEVL